MNPRFQYELDPPLELRSRRRSIVVARRIFRTFRVGDAELSAGVVTLPDGSRLATVAIRVGERRLASIRLGPRNVRRLLAVLEGILAEMGDR